MKSESSAPSVETQSIHIQPSGPLGGYVTVPPSKNYTTRLLLAAALADGRSVIRAPSTNDDARALVRCLRALGATITETGADLTIEGVAGRPKNPGTLNPGNAGAVLRMLLGVACLADGEIRFETDYTESLGRRPNKELLDALGQLGAQAEGTGTEATLPIVIHGGRERLSNRRVTVDCSRSSQFLSSILFLTSHLEGERRIEVMAPATDAAPALVSRPLIDQTLEVLRDFGAEIEASPDLLSFRTGGRAPLTSGEHRVPGDWPSAVALMSAVAVAGGMVELRGLREDMQGERRAQEALRAMGCEFTRSDSGELFVHSKGEPKATEFNGDLATDAVLALEAAAALAQGTSRFSGIANLRLKESDRIAEPLKELAKLGIQARSGEDWVEIDGRPEGLRGGIDVDCRGDHRIAQMLAIIGIRCADGLSLRGTECVSKSYPGFFEDLERMGVKLTRLD